ncbi:MAG: response regulator transcription factor, partial [Eubacteriales bacterium]|nr:response regulator transcription factor [Eubacteriales bacterium]
NCLETTPIDLAILDLMLPDIDGLTICRLIREKYTFPILMLTARDSETDQIIGLTMGADDYITKPFSPREVVARIKAVLRRIHELTESSKGSHLVAGNLDIDMSAFIVKLGDEVIPCTPKEIEILWTLAGNPGMVFSREHLLQSIWGYDFLGDTRAVDSHIKRIRAKLCRPGNNWDIKTVWGVGYRFEMEEDG